MAAKPRQGPKIMAVSATANVCKVMGTINAPTGMAGARENAAIRPAKTATRARSVSVDGLRRVISSTPDSAVRSPSLYGRATRPVSGS